MKKPIFKIFLSTLIFTSLLLFAEFSEAATFTCTTGPTPHYSTGCDLLKHFDSDGNGLLEAGNVGELNNVANARTYGQITDEEFNFVMQTVNLLGSINAVCPNCYIPPAVCNPDGCNNNCPANCTGDQDPDCNCIANGCCGVACTSANDVDCFMAPACSPDGCNNNCPANCTVDQDPDCACRNDNNCCGVGCTYTNDNDCLAPSVCIPNGCNQNCPANCTVDQDPDCACENDNNCCGVGCTYTNDNNCPLPTTPPPSGGIIIIDNPLNATSFEGVIDSVINFIFYVALAIAPLMVIVGAFYYLTSAGDPGKIEKAQNIILYTAIGFAVILFSKGLVAIIKQVLGF